MCGRGSLARRSGRGGYVTGVVGFLFVVHPTGCARHRWWWFTARPSSWPNQLATHRWPWGSSPCPGARRRSSQRKPGRQKSSTTRGARAQGRGCRGNWLSKKARSQKSQIQHPPPNTKTPAGGCLLHLPAKSGRVNFTKEQHTDRARGCLGRSSALDMALQKRERGGVLAKAQCPTSAMAPEPAERSHRGPVLF